MNAKSIHTIFVLVLLLLPCHLSATTLVVIVTPRAIVMGADGKGVSGTIDSVHRDGAHISTEDKIVLLQDKIIVGTTGIARIRTPEGYVKYSFTEWINRINKFPDKKTPTVTQLARKVKFSCFKIFNDEYAGQLRSGTLQPLNLSNNPGLPLVTYYVAGYEEGKPKVFKILIEIDWLNKVLKRPVMNEIYPDLGTRKNLWFHWHGQPQKDIDDLLTASSQTQKTYLMRYPKEIGALIYDEPLRCDEVVKLAKITLSLEISASPDEFSFPVNVYALSDCKENHYSYAQ